MNEQYCIDWINSLDIPEAEFINKIEDLYDKSYIILNMICIILNKNLEEIINIIGAIKSLNSLENISLIMNLYFDYKYDYSNKENLNKNTLFLIQFLKSRYPKEIQINNNKFEENPFKNNNTKYKNNNYPGKINNRDSDNIHPYSDDKNVEDKTNSQIKKLKSYKQIVKNLNSYSMNDFNTTPNLDNISKRNEKKRIINTSYSNYLNNKISHESKRDNYSFYKEIKNLFPNNSNKFNKTKKISKNKSQDISFKKIPKSNIIKNSKSFSSNNLNKVKKAIKTENNEYPENFIKKVITSKIPNYFLKIIGKPILKKDYNFYYYQFPKLTSPITEINIEINKFNQSTKNNYYKLPFLLQNLMGQKNKMNNNQNLNINKNNQKNGFNHININKLDKKENFILNFLNKKAIIKSEQKNSNYLWKILIPDLKDGYIIGKLINLLENKNKNYLKGITKETFYKVNIYYNWQKIIDFLNNKKNFNSIYLYQKNFYSNDEKLFNFLYDLLKFYSQKISINNNEIKNFNLKYDINISNIQNNSNHNLISNSNILNKEKSFKNRSFNSTQIQKNKKNKKEFLKTYNNNQVGSLKMNETPSVTEIMNIRKSINYIHRENKSLVIFPNKKQTNNNMNNLNKSEDYINLQNKENYYKKGENKVFDKNVSIIISFLQLIGINTSQINFYIPEMKIFKDGILLYQILTQLENNSLIVPKIDLNPKHPSTAINNHRLIINFLSKYKKNFPVELTGKERELYKSNPKFILKFLNILKNIYDNEVYYYEKLKLKNNNNNNTRKSVKNSKINPKNIDKSERYALPLSQELRDKFLIKGNEKIWA